MPFLRTLGAVPASLLDTLGDWNPQLRRELKGRLRRLPMLVAMGLAVLVQGVVLLVLANALPGTVEISDLELTTFPQVQVSWAAELPATTLQTALPTDDTLAAERRNQDLFVETIGQIAPHWGDRALGQAALDQLRVGDRLVAIDGQPMTTLRQEVNPPDQSWDWHRLSRRVHEAIRGGDAYAMTPAQRSLLNTTVDLTLDRPGQGEFTVTLPRVALVDRWSTYCMADAEHQGEDIYSYRRRYGRTCQVAADGQRYLVNWPYWHRNLFLILSGVMVLALMGGGLFRLMSNLAMEQQHGTLNFLRMSPRSALTVLGGKLLGVPVCLYLGVGLMVPLHTYAGLAAGMSPAQLVGFALVVLCQTLLLYLVGLLLALASQSTMVLASLPLVGTVVALLFQWLVGALTMQVWHENHLALPLDWAVLFSPLGSAGYLFRDAWLRNDAAQLQLNMFRLNFWQYTGLVVAHTGAWALLLGHVLQRQFEQPGQPLLARRYSYPLTGAFMAGVLLLSDTGIERRNLAHSDLAILLVLIGVMAAVYGLVLALALNCDRQTLQDWTRFRTARTRTEGRLPLGRDLLFGDTSSPVVALGLNLALCAVLFGLWCLLYYPQLLSERSEILMLVGSTVLAVGSVFFAVLAGQVLLLAKQQKGWLGFGALSTISVMLFPGLTLVIAVGLVPAALSNATLWGLPPEVAMFVIPLSLMGGCTGLLGLLHWRQFVRLGQSEYRLLMAASERQ